MTPGFRPELHDIAAAASLLTRFPVPVDHARAGLRAAQAVWAYPLIGAALGLVAGCGMWLALALGLPYMMAALLALTVLVVTTGALHEDGLADSADGLGSGATGTRLREIMKDSRIGAFGVVALVLAFGLRGSGAATLAAYPIVACTLAAALSRLPMVAVMAWMPLASDRGLAAAVGRPPAAAVWLAGTVSLTLAVVCLGWVGLLSLLCALLAPLPLLRVAQKRLGGHSGDILGGTQQLAEIGVWIGLALLLV